MNTAELQNFMLKDKYISKYYGGVLASDQLPIFVRNKPKIFIVNTDESFKPGLHWTVIYIDEKVPEYFDPLGDQPIEVFQDFLILNGLKYKINTKKVQSSLSSLCEMYCLFYAYFRCRDYSMNQILNVFRDNLLINDIIASYFYKFINKIQ